MLITTGKVNDGVIQVETEDVPEGTTVTVVTKEPAIEVLALWAH